MGWRSGIVFVRGVHFETIGAKGYYFESGARRYEDWGKKK